MRYEDFIIDPYGTQSGGFNPTMSEFARRSIQQAQSQHLTNQILMQDPRARLQSQILASNMGLKSVSESMQLGVSSFINSRMLSPMMGGSRLDLFAGINAGFANSGRIMGGQGSFYGAGSMTSDFSADLMKRTEAHFYNASGGARRHLTQGLNRSDFGRMMSEFGASGMLSGWGGYEGGVEGVPVTASADTFEKTKKIMQDGAKVISGLQDILGSKNMDEIMGAMNSLAGGTIASVEKLNVVKERLNRIKSMAAERGGSAEAYMAVHAQYSAAFRSVGISGGHAASMGMQAMGRTSAARVSMMESRQFSSSLGYDIPDQMEAIGAENVKDAAALTQENPVLNTMLYAINASGLTPSAKANLKAKISQAVQSSNGSPGDLRNKLQGISSEVFGATGGSASSWYRASGGNLQAGLTESDIALSTELSFGVMDKRGAQQFGNALLNAGVHRGDVARYQSYRDKYSMSTIAGVASGSITGHEMSQGEAEKMLLLLNSNVQLQNSQNAEDLLTAKNAARVEMYAELEFGKDLKGVTGLEAIAGTLLGDTKVTDSAIRAYLRGGTSGITGRKVTEEEALKIRMAGGFVDAVGSGSDRQWYAYDQTQKEAAASKLEDSLTRQTLSAANLDPDKYMDAGDQKKSDYLKEAISDTMKDGLDKTEVNSLAGLARLTPGAQNEILSQLKEREEKVRGKVGKKGPNDKQAAELDAINNLREQLVTREDTSDSVVLKNIYSLLQDFNSKLNI